MIFSERDNSYISNEAWQIEYFKAIQFYCLLGLSREKAEMTALRELDRKYYTIAGG